MPKDELGEEYGTYTTWEREREAEEFSRAAKLYRPLSSMMASRFTRAKYDDDTEKEQVPPEQVINSSFYLCILLCFINSIFGTMVQVIT